MALPQPLIRGVMSEIASIVGIYKSQDVISVAFSPAFNRWNLTDGRIKLAYHITLRVAVRTNTYLGWTFATRGAANILITAHDKNRKA